jgi:hypothetical protein
MFLAGLKGSALPREFLPHPAPAEEEHGKQSACQYEPRGQSN